MIKFIDFPLILLTVTTLLGCVSQQYYRQGNFVAHGRTGNFVAHGCTCVQSTKAENCETAEEGKSEKGEPYFLGIVEFDDSGLLFNLDQLDFVINELKNRAASLPIAPAAPLIMMVL